MKQYYKIANLIVELDSFGKTQEQAIPYLTQATTPDLVIESDYKSLQEKFPHLSADDCEYLGTGAQFYRKLLDFDGLMIHASAVVLDGKAYLFSAPCGTGKSTHTALWCSVFGEGRAMILNDDKPALRLENGTFFAYGTPWSGKTDKNVNLRVPVAGICTLRRGKENIIKPYTGAAAIHAILDQTLRVKNPQFMTKLMDLLVTILEKVPVWHLECNMEPEAAITAYEAMSGLGKE